MYQARDGAAARGLPRRRIRHKAAFLDALFPGLGHAVSGRRRRAVVLAVPVLVLLLLGIVVFVTTPTIRLLALGLDPALLATFFGLQALILIWRLIAVASSLFDPRLPRMGRRDALPIAALAVLLIVPQALAGYATNVAREVSDEIIPVNPETVGAWNPKAYAEGPITGDFEAPSGSPSASPSATPGVARQNVLMIGVDAGVGRRTFLTDTMIVVSLDPVAETVSMISIPRDMVDVPLPDGRRFKGKINSLLSFAKLHPGDFPGSDGSGHDVLMGALGTLLGIRIDHFAQVNLGGFVQVVNLLGGVDVDVHDGFCDPTYDEYGFTKGFAISPGRHHLNGNQALAFARVRKAAGESDFTRAARQQEVLSGIRDQVKKGGFLRDPIGLLKAVGKTVVTNIPRSLLPDLADVASRVGRTATYRAVINHPLVRSGSDVRGSILKPDLAGIRKLADALFTPTGTPPPATDRVPESKGKVAGSGVSSCKRAATPAPKPKPTPIATPKPSVAPSPPPSVPSAVPAPS